MGPRLYSVMARQLNGTSPSEIQPYLEPRLIDAGLADEQIHSYTLEELEKSLGTVNTMLLNPQTGGDLGKDRLAVLYSRKKLILERIIDLRGQDKLADIRRLVALEHDESLRAELGARIVELQAEFAEWRRRTKEVEDEAQAQVNGQTKLHKAEIAARRWKTVRSFVAKESLGTLVSGVLLVAIFLLLVYLSVFNEKRPEALEAGFLVTLGYFCGQANGTRARHGKPPHKRKSPLA
jgi:hypothetical protein